MFEKIVKEDVFHDPDIPFEILRRGKESALRDKRTGLLVLPFSSKNRFYNSVPGTTNQGREAETFLELGKKMIIYNNGHEGKSVLIVNDEVKLIKAGCEFNFFSMNKNLNYICIQEFGEGKTEYIYDINNSRAITPKYIAIHPAAKFPQVALYKAHTKEGDALYSWPDNKRLTDFSQGFSSMGRGLGQGTSFVYTMMDKYMNEKYFEKWNIPFLPNMDNKTIEQIVGDDFQVKLSNHRDVIKRVFKMRFKK